MEEEDEQSLFTHSDTASCILTGMGGKARRFWGRSLTAFGKDGSIAIEFFLGRLSDTY